MTTLARRLTVLALAIGLTLTAAPAAHGAYLSNFRVRDSGASIVWAVSVCTAGTGSVKKFSAWIEPEDGFPRYTRTANGGRTGPGCDRWSFRTRDVWAEGIWRSQLRVVMSNGQILRTGVRELYIS